MGGKESEACGRCSMSSAVSVAGADGDVIGEERIEVPEDELRKVSPGAWLGRVKRRLDEVATRLTYGR